MLTCFKSVIFQFYSKPDHGKNTIKTRLNQKHSLEQIFNAMAFREKLQKTLITGHKTIFVTLCSGSRICLHYYNIFLRDFLRKKSSRF